MISQRISPKKLKPWQGLMMVMGIAALLLAATALVNLLKSRTDPVWGQISVLLLAGLGAWYVMRNFILEFQYTVHEGVFYIERIYGQRSRVMLQLPLSDILYLGGDRQAAARWPQARIMVDATLKHPIQPLEKVCFAYRKDGQIHLGLVQANVEMQTAMFDLQARQASAREKWG